MRVLVTGGAGFIGSHVVDALRKRGDHPIVLDNFTSGSRSNLAHETEIIEGEIADSTISARIADANPDAIIHAAAQASVPRSMADPTHDRAVNLVGTENVIEGARLAGHRRIVFLSTGGGIYGETASPAREDSVPQPKSFYSVHKYVAERYVELSTLPYAIARLANIYGPRQQSHLEGGVVAIFAERLLSGQSVAIYGTGEQSRDLVHVHDAATAILAMLDTSVNGMWNVGTGTATSINELLTMMESIIAPASSIVREDFRIGDVKSSCLSADKIASDLGWRPQLSLLDGLTTLSRL